MTNILKLAHRAIVFTTLAYLPFALIFSFINFGAIFSSPTAQRLYEAEGSLLLFWLICVIYTIGSLALNERFRHQVILRVTGLQERDEREDLIVARAARDAFFFTTALALFVMVSTTFRVNFYEDPKFFGPWTVSWGNFATLNRGGGSSHFQWEIKASNRETTLVNSYDGPLSKFGTLSFLLGTNVISFLYFARRHARRME